LIWALAAVTALAAIPAGLRWLRVAQREHYLSASVIRFAWRWWRAGPVNMTLAVVGLAGLVGSAWEMWPGLLVAAAQVGPVGLGIRGSTSPLAWTSRLRRLAAVTGVVLATILVIGGLIRSPLVVVLPLALLPVMMDLALLLLAPMERIWGTRWVDRASRKLATIDPSVVAITGSYGKTTTKGYTAHLLSGSKRTVATPGSFNNRMGLARAINETLTPGTEVFVAEMGTYGPGEIAEMCRWVTPDIAVIVSIGPVHLERFKTEERVVAAKAEILDRAGVAVICVDHPLLARLAADRSESMRVIEVSAGDRGSVRVTGGRVILDGDVVASIPGQVFDADLAAAIGVCSALGVDPAGWVPRLADLPTPEHRQTSRLGESGFTIIDDTFNSNPAGAMRALGLLGSSGAGVKAVVTPGMVELGPRQDEENTAFAAAAAAVADHLLIVGATNREALLRGSSMGQASVTVVGSRDEAVAWVRANLGPGDAVLYENDLPDHYP
jgi:UDP-N-acetylmuramoyl-tripeptide--D-alanyl-D-alanine ligase